MKNHLKRIAAPKTWNIDRTKGKYVIKATSGSHALNRGLPLALIIRDMLKLASTFGEVKKILNNQEVLVDGKRRKEPHFVVGLFDLLTFPQLHKNYRLLIDKKGRLIVKEVPINETTFKVCKIIGKKILAQWKIQFNLYDGKNIIAELKAKVGDSLVLSLPDLKIKEVLPLKENAIVFLVSGKHSGDIGQLKEIKQEEAIYLINDEEVYTSKDYLFVIGNKKPLFTIEN